MMVFDPTKATHGCMRDGMWQRIWEVLRFLLYCPTPWFARKWRLAIFLLIGGRVTQRHPLRSGVSLGRRAWLDFPWNISIFVMKIAIITSPFCELPPDAIGAVERRWANTAVEFAAQGHSVELLGKRGRTILPSEERLRRTYVRGYQRTASVYTDIILDFFYSFRALCIFCAYNAKAKKLPQLVSLAEAVRTVVSHQTATGTYPSNALIVPNRSILRNGEWRRALFVSRMHPKKGVLELVEAWASLRQSNSRAVEQWSCELVYTIGGDAEREYEAMVKRRILDLGMTYIDAASRCVGREEVIAPVDFVFTGPLDDKAKWEAYRRADCFVLPTHTENFGIVIAEALYAELPVITTKGAPWQELEKTGSGWWIDLSVKSLAKALNGAMDLPNDELREMGRRGKELVVSRYSWNQIAQGMKSAYAELIA